MKIETLLKQMNRIKIDDSIIQVDVNCLDKRIVMKGPAFDRLFPVHKTEPLYRYVERCGVCILTYDPDPNSDEADTRQVTP